MGTPPVMCDIVAVSSFTIHLSVMEYHGAGAKSFWLWLCLAIASTFFPALVATLSHAAARAMIATPAPTSDSMCSLARSLEPFLFGLRYSVLATFVGLQPCMDAAVLTVIFPKTLKTISSSLIMKNCFLEAVPKSFILAYFGAKLAILSVPFLDGKDFQVFFDAFLWMADSVLAVVILIALNFVLNKLFAMGITLGTKIAAQAQADVRPDGLQKDYNLLGMVGFGTWACLLGMLTQFQ
jgi:hypothetical protein